MTEIGTASLPIINISTISAEAQPRTPKTNTEDILRTSRFLHPVINELVHPFGSALEMGPHDSPTYGSTSCLGKLPLQLQCGTFNVYAFETTSFGKHVLALTMGDVSSPDPLLIRMHSECVTSETLRGCDCDCVEQLDAALERIAEEGRGVVFYLRQEGRGAGYPSKGRDRMTVAASECSPEGAINTFGAYKAMGLKADPRSYEFMSDLVYLLGISAPLRVMTNNPNKLEGIESATGLRVLERCPIVVPANPFNLGYLKSKGEEGGHFLDYDGETGSSFPWKVEAFKPYPLPEKGAMRFTHVASYPLPVRPQEGVMLLSVKEIAKLGEIIGGTERLQIEKTGEIGKMKVTLPPEVLREGGVGTTPLNVFIGKHPYWFNDHVYHDRIDHLDYVALTYNQDPKAIPVVRVQSENLLARFPMEKEKSAIRYERSVQEIVDNGRGMLLLYPEDGRGKGFSSLFMEKILVHHGLATDNADAIRQLGCAEESRDYRSLAALIRTHYGDSPIRLAVGSERSRTVEGLRRAGIEIEGIISLGPTH